MKRLLLAIALAVLSQSTARADCGCHGNCGREGCTCEAPAAAPEVVAHVKRFPAIFELRISLKAARQSRRENRQIRREERRG